MTSSRSSARRTQSQSVTRPTTMMEEEEEEGTIAGDAWFDVTTAASR